MNNKNTYYYEWNKEKLKKYACNCYDLKNGKVKSKEYYENNKETLQEQARNGYRNLSEEEKDKKLNTEEIDIKTCLKKIQKN